MRSTLVAWVEDRPGVLARVVGMFRRRNFNIVSLTVGQSERPELSRLTVVVDSDSTGAGLVEANLLKLVEVVEVHDVTHIRTVQRELALIKVRAGAASRGEIAQLAEIFRAKLIDVTHDAVIVEVSGDSGKIDSLIELLKPKGVLEVMRTGVVAMARGLAAGAPEDAEGENADSEAAQFRVA